MLKPSYFFRKNFTILQPQKTAYDFYKGKFWGEKNPPISPYFKEEKG
jgi:hypothetical protein